MFFLCQMKTDFYLISALNPCLGFVSCCSYNQLMQGHFECDFTDVLIDFKQKPTLKFISFVYSSNFSV